MKKMVFAARMALIFTLSGVGASCQMDGGFVENQNPKQELSFSATAQDETRVVNSTWDAGDAIGVFRATPTASGAPGAIFESSKKFTTTGNGTFNAASEGDKITITQDVAPFELWAYYPHSTEASGIGVPVNITNQSSQSKLDIMWGRVANVSNFTPPPHFTFARQTIRVVLNVAAGEGVSSLTGITATVKNAATKGTLNVSTGTLNVDASSKSPFAALVSGVTTAAARVEFTLLPETGATPTVTFTFGTSTFDWTPDRALEQGKRYTWTVTLTDSEGNGGGGNGSGVKYFETPVVPTTGAGTTLIYLDRNLPGTGARAKMRNYQMLFDTKEKIAYWVAYPMHSQWLGSSGRTNNWGYDPDVPTSSQVGSYTSGWSRGHQLPSSHRTGSSAENTTTFYYTNITPQNSNVNSGQINTIDERVRNSWMGQCDTMYCVTGAGFYPGTTIRYSNGAAIPDYYYKALAKLTIGANGSLTYNTVAFKMDNASQSAKWDTFRMSVTKLEEETGITFFPSLPKEVKDAVNASLWQ